MVTSRLGLFVNKDLIWPWITSGLDCNNRAIGVVWLKSGDPRFPLMNDFEGMPLEFFENGSCGIPTFYHYMIWHSNVL